MSRKKVKRLKVRVRVLEWQMGLWRDRVMMAERRIAALEGEAREAAERQGRWVWKAERKQSSEER